MVTVRRTGWDARPEQSPDGKLRARRRYHGSGKRGKASRASTDALDLRIAIAELTGAHELIVRTEHADLTPMDRRENRRAAIAKVQLARRAIKLVLERPEPK